LPQEIPLALTKATISPSERKTPPTPSDKFEESPSALDLRCPSFIFHFPNRMPSSAPSAYQRNISALVSCSPTNIQTSSLSTSKKRRSIETQQKSLKRHKVIRKLNFDEHKSSPVSGTFIRDSDSEDDFTAHPSCVRRSGDIDPSLNVVVITEEARAEIAKIENKIGDYICALCKERYQDAFGLAQHRCTRIVHVEYRCPECDKVFNCPANLASHRRWHKPRNNTNNENNGKKTKVLVAGTATIHPDSNNTSNCSVETNSTTLGETTLTNQESLDGQYECEYCPKKFRRNAYLKKHLLTLHNFDNENNKPTENSEKEFPLNTNIFKSNQKVLDFSISVNKTPINEKEIARTEFSKCLVCSNVFHNEISLEMHYKSVHKNETLSCKYCENMFFNGTELTLHINNYHSTKESQTILQSVRPVST